MSDTRDRIIETTCQLLEAQGYHATSLNQILAASGAPKGSLYYYFPGGKEELAAAAVEQSAHIVADRISSSLAAVEDPAEAVRRFVLTLADQLRATDFRGGGPITTVALEAVTASRRVNLACQAAYRQWGDAFRDKLLTTACSREEAAELATVIIASLEGAILLSRIGRTAAPLEQLAPLLYQLITGATLPSPSPSVADDPGSGDSAGKPAPRDWRQW